MTSKSSTTSDTDSNQNEDTLYHCMYRITAGLPQHELKLMAKEARDCESALKKEIEILEKALSGTSSENQTEDNSSKGASSTVNAAEGGMKNRAVGSTMGDGSTTVDGDGNDKNTTIAGSTGGDGNTSKSTDGNSQQPGAGALPTSSHSQPSSLGHTTSSGRNTNPTANATLPLVTSLIPPAYDATQAINANQPNYLTTSAEILAASDLTPLDRYFTVSSLLGRLRDPFDTPPPPHSSLAIAREKGRMADLKRQKSSKKSSDSAKSSSQPSPSLLKYHKIINIAKQFPIYTEPQTNDTTALLALWKRISSHRTAAVFRRAVNAKEAPGYKERILFPIDLGLIRKMISCGYITTFEEFHRKIGLICHNCVKFNGRESDYAILTREFETYVDDSFLDVMGKLEGKRKAKMKATAAAVETSNV